MRSRFHSSAIAVLVALLVAGAATVRLAAAPADPRVADAAMHKDADGVRALLKDGADVNAAQADGMTALHWAALNGDVPTLDLLLLAGATRDALTRVGAYTPLHLASQRGHGEVVAHLLDAGAKPGPFTTTGVQPIHLAAESGSVAAVTALLDHGADINAVDKTHGRNPLVFAVSKDRRDVVGLLASRGANLAQTTMVIDYQARASDDRKARETRDKVVSAQTGRTVNSAFDPDPPQPGAAAASGVGNVSNGRGAPAQAPAPGGFGGRGGPLGPGMRRPPSDVEQIGKQGGFTALHYAARDGFSAAAAALVDAGLDVNVPTAGDHSTPMTVALINGQYDLALMLLKRGANPNLANQDGVTPLFATLNNEWALRTWYPQPTAGSQQRASYMDVLEALLKAGADPNVRTTSHIWYAAYNTGRMGVDFAGATPFWRAAYSLDVDAMRLLVKYGADPDIPTMTYGASRRPDDPSGLQSLPAGAPHVPAFHAASGVGYGTSRVAQQHRHVPDGWLPAAKYFIEELGVNVNVRDADGFTALHHAAARGDNETINYLISKGADPLAVNRVGQTTVDMANSPEQRTQPFPETIALLEALGAKNNHNCRACK
ncbi:MAG: ankyrin repeat domain-containing protein [Vicinamibacterales bacterium]